MIATIGNGVTPAGGISGVGAGSAVVSPPAPGFSKILEDAIKAVDTQQASADTALYGIATGQKVDLHATMIAEAQADISIRTMASVRDKVVGAYHEIWNMPI